MRKKLNNDFMEEYKSYETKVTRFLLIEHDKNYFQMIICEMV